MGSGTSTAGEIKSGVVVGIGAIAVDHVFVAQSGRSFCYHASRGGGSVWNLLAHLARAGFKTMACGAFADDDLGTEAVGELAHLGVDTSRLVRRTGKHTPVFTQWLDEDWRHGPPVPQENFTVDCPICGRISCDDAVQFSGSLFAVDAHPRPLAVCADRLTSETISVVRAAARSGCLTALDLGGVSGLKDRDRRELGDWIGEFDLVAMPSAVASWLADTTVAQFAARLLARRTGALAVTCGRDGFHLNLRAANDDAMARTSAAPSVAHVVDATGAGDAFMAQFIDCVLQSAARQATDWRLSFPDADVDAIVAKLRAAPVGVLGEVGSRGTLPAHTPSTGWAMRLAALRGQPLEALRRQFAEARPCSFCGRA
jgi:sugar/nucleoside kinase (ribokinase family)